LEVKCWDIPVSRLDVPVEAVLAAFEALVPRDTDAHRLPSAEAISGIMVEAPDGMTAAVVRHHFREALKTAGSKATEGPPREFPCGRSG
jgi:hypothetical protein